MMYISEYKQEFCTLYTKVDKLNIMKNLRHTSNDKIVNPYCVWNDQEDVKNCDPIILKGRECNDVPYFDKSNLSKTVIKPVHETKENLSIDATVQCNITKNKELQKYGMKRKILKKKSQYRQNSPHIHHSDHFCICDSSLKNKETNYALKHRAGLTSKNVRALTQLSEYQLKYEYEPNMIKKKIDALKPKKNLQDFVITKKLTQENNFNKPKTNSVNIKKNDKNVCTSMKNEKIQCDLHCKDFDKHNTKTNEIKKQKKMIDCKKVMSKLVENRNGNVKINTNLSNNPVANVAQSIVNNSEYIQRFRPPSEYVYFNGGFVPFHTDLHNEFKVSDNHGENGTPEKLLRLSWLNQFKQNKTQAINHRMKSRDRSLLADILNSIDNSQLKTFKRLNLQRKNLQETTKNENSITEDIKTLMNSKREECTQTSLKHKFTQCDALHCENFNVDSDQPLKNQNCSNCLVKSNKTKISKSNLTCYPAYASSTTPSTIIDTTGIESSTYEGRVPTPDLMYKPKIHRHHLDKTTPVSGDILVSHPKFNRVFAINLLKRTTERKAEIDFRCSDRASV